jgi:hypothetical protein
MRTATPASRTGIPAIRRRTLAALAPLALVLSLGVGAGSATAQEGTLVTFDFEDGVAGWQAPDWLESNAGDVSQSDAQAVGGDYSLALPVSYPAGSGWAQSGAGFRFDTPFSASGLARFHVYAPADGLSARFQFNDPWTEPTSLRPLSPGWNEVVYDIDADFAFPVTEVNEILLFVVAQNLPATVDDTVYFDDVSFTSGEPGEPEPPDGDLAFDFEDGVTGWFTPDWLAANNPDEPITQSDAQAATGDHSLALPVIFPQGSGFAQAGAVYRFPDAPVNLLGYEAVRFQVYAPIAGLSADFIFNDPWNPPTGWRGLAPGWNELVFDITPGSGDWPGGVPSANEFILRVVAQNPAETYDGPVWFDDVEFVPGTAPVLSMVSPERDATVSAPHGEQYQIEVVAGASEGRELTGVTWRSGTQQGALADAGDTWVGDWDVWAEDEGVTELAVIATDDAGESTTARATVLVRNSRMSVEITSPGFDAEVTGEIEVTATVTSDDRFDLDEVVLYGLENDLGEIAMDSGAGQWAATLDTTRLADGVESLAVEARDGQFAVRDLAHVVVRNSPPAWDYVAAEGTSFVHQGEPFRYAGFNEYELFTTPENFGRSVEQELGETILGEVLLPGTGRRWEDNVDRQLLEAARHGQTVLRTWAFDRNAETSAFQRMIDGEIVFQESTFERFDYIMDSARRHGIRVIVTLDNYWPDYGGINTAAQWLGLENKLQFFTDPAAIALYQDYAAHFLTRVNTVNGIPYAQDPTVFAWELMNEPRTDCAADPTPDRRYCDPTGEVMRDWMSAQASFVKNLAPDQMVSPGGEAHGWIPTPGGGIQFGGPEESNHNIPFYDMDVPEVDFLTFHPYPNASWAGLTKQQTEQLVVSTARMGVARGKPVVMEEWGIDRTQPVYTGTGELVEPGAAGYERERQDHYRMMAEACYLNGCAGTNVWMFADWADSSLNVNLYRPGPAAERDAPIVADLAGWAGRFADGTAPPVVTPGCKVRYRAVPLPSGRFAAVVRVTNTGDRTVDGWRLGWWFEGGQEVEVAIGASTTQDGALVAADGEPPLDRIKAGRSRTVLLLATAGSGGNPDPAVFTLNGEVCTTR